MSETVFPILLDVISPEVTLVHENVASVELPGTIGRFEVLRNHAPLISSLVEGEIRYMAEDGQAHSVKVQSGFVEIIDNHVTACVEL